MGSRLKILKDRLQKSDFPDALFFAITPGSISNSVENSPEDDVEQEAWERVSPEEVMEISTGLINWQPLETIISSDIFLIKDNDELNIWKQLKGTRDQILIIDRCGKLAYQVIVPWSILHFPYVKAAIISTHKDDPCGACDAYARVFEFDDMTNSKITESLVDNDGNKMTSESSVDEGVTAASNIEEEINNYQENMVLPIRIIMRAPHRHVDEDSADKHEYLVLKTDEVDYHGHLEGSGEKLENMARNNKKEIVFDRDEGPGLNGEVADFWRDEGDYLSATENIDVNYIESYESSTMVADSPEAVTNLPEFTVEEEESRSKMIAHYSRLLPWIDYVLED